MVVNRAFTEPVSIQVMAPPATTRAMTLTAAAVENRPRISAVERTGCGARRNSTMVSPTRPPSHTAAAVTCTMSLPTASHR